MDAADVFWQEWILDYDLNHQLTLAAKVDESRRSFFLDRFGRWWKSGAAAADRSREWVRDHGADLLVVALVLAGLILLTPRLGSCLAGRFRVSRL